MRLLYLLLISGAALAQTWTIVDFPGAGGTVVQGLNNNGDVTGYYVDSANNTHGFMRTAAGVYTSFDFPGSAGQTRGVSINDAGTVAGGYEAEPYFFQYKEDGFLRTAAGQFTSFSALPGGVARFDDTYVTAMNNAGAVAGFDVHPFSNVDLAFLRNPAGNTVNFGPPVAGAIAIRAIAINNKGVIAGDFFNGYVYQGFLRSASGTFTLLIEPDAGNTAGSYSYPASINDQGAVAGAYSDAGILLHGFLRSPAGDFTTIDAPGEIQGPYYGTTAVSVNNEGVVTGYYTDAGSIYRGFVRRPSGSYSTFAAPGAPTHQGEGSNGTVPFAINNAGVIAGNYADSRGVSHGFLLTQ